MRIFRHYERLPDRFRGAAIAVGNFDGVHLGHRAVIGEAGRIAHADGIPWAVLTFEPHPRSVFHPDRPPFRLTPFRVKARLIEEAGPEVLIVIHFDETFSRIPAREFVRRVLVEGAAAQHVVCGHDFAFGHDREGNSELLLQLGGEFGFGFTCVREVRDADGHPYSSTRVRHHLASGDAAAAAHVLGRPFEVEGEVVGGDRRGRTIGFPTANLELREYIHPARGVYAVKAGIVDGDRTLWYDGVANLGRRPTFDGTRTLLEVHLFAFDGDLYGKALRVAFIDYLRPEKKFDGLDDLRAQIAVDSARARDILTATAGSSSARAR
ncbi:MAG: bifunctional riboflavin kinase/FAD synthetase [Rhodospirillales bacterium]